MNPGDTMSWLSVRLWLPAILSTTAGAVDVIGFLALGGLFAAHITGNLAIVAAAVGVHGKEGDIFRRVFIWSLVFLAFMCALSGLQSSVLAWMVP